MVKVFLSLDKLTTCAALSTNSNLDVKVRKVFKWWCAHLVQNHSNDRETMIFLQKGSSQSFWFWLLCKWWNNPTTDKRKPWRKLLKYLNLCNSTLAQFFYNHRHLFFQYVENIHISPQQTNGIKTSTYFQVANQPMVAHPTSNRGVYRYNFVELRKVTQTIQQDNNIEGNKENGEEEGNVLGKRKRDELGLIDMDRKQRARFLVRKLLQNKRMNSDYSDYMHISNVLKGHVDGRFDLINEERLLLKVLGMTSFEKDVVNILANFF